MRDKKELLYKRTLITCVVMLFVSITLKLFGSTLFDLNTDIPILQEMDEIIMNSVPLSFMYSFILMLINSTLVFMIVTKKRINKINLGMLVVFSIGMIGYKATYNTAIISFILEILCLLLICILETNNLSTIRECGLALLLNFVYQAVSLFIKDIAHLETYNVVIATLFMIDYYIMLIITYLYLKKGDITLWEFFHQSFSYLRNLLLRKRTVSSKQCLNKGEHDG